MTAIKQQTFLQIRSLADRMDAAQSGGSPRITVFVGAGGSVPAGYPQSNKLAAQIRDDFVKGSDGLREFLDTEVRATYGDKAPASLNLFELCSIVSQSEFGRKSLRQTVSRALSSPESRPLGLELVAHLSKHRFVQNIVSLNFDTLLDEAFRDELPERTRFILSEQDVPPEPNDNFCYVTKPFGSVGEGQYSLSKEDVDNFGPPAIERFIRNHVIGEEHATIVLIGYRGAETGFLQLLQRHQGSMEIFVIDKDVSAARELKELLPKHFNIHEIELYGDAALDILVEVLADKVKDAHSWIPPSRHRVISRCKHGKIERRRSGNSNRFVLELLLQAVKSRGFIHLESFSVVPRLGEYGTKGVAKKVDRLLQEGILKRDHWLTRKRSKKPGEVFVPNYVLSSTLSELAKWIADEMCLLKDVQIHHVSAGGVDVQKVSIYKYIEDQLSSIDKATDIEIYPSELRETRWNLDKHSIPLGSPRDLFRLTRESLERFSEGGSLRGIWSTGEWLFHDNGWASQLRDTYLNEGKVKIQAVITDRGGIPMRRSDRRNEVISWMSQHENVEVRYLDWWELNRVLSIFEPEDEDGSAIYFRRRLNQPLVQPFWIPLEKGKKRKQRRSQRYIEELWSRYWSKARLDPLDDSR